MRILIIDDERSIRFTLSKFLEQDGHHVDLAEDGSRALILQRQNTYDVCLCDILMPDYNGVELLPLLLQENPESLIVLMTGQPGIESVAEALRRGAKDYLVKPVTKEMLRHCISRLSELLSLRAQKQALELETRRQQAKLNESLTFTRTLYETLVNSLPLNLFRLDSELRITFAHCAADGLLFRGSADLQGLREAELYKDQHASRAEAYSQRVLAQGNSQRYNETVLLADGRQATIAYVKSPLWDEHFQKVTGVQCLCWDISEDTRTRNQAHLLQQAIDQSPVSILITDRLGRIEYVNPRFCETTGYTEAEVVGKRPSLLKSGEMPKEAYAQLWSTITSGKVWQGELHNRRKDGHLIWESVTICPVRNESGAIIRFLAVRENTTEKKELERLYLRAQRLESIGTLASGIAHDLNNILTPVLMCSGLLNDVSVSPEQKNLLETIESSARRAQAIVRQLLTLSRGADDAHSSVQPLHLLREVQQIIKETFPKNIQLRVLCPDEVPTVRGTPTKLHQILLNLCVNAKDAMPDGGSLTLSLHHLQAGEAEDTREALGKLPEAVRLRVQDTGTGIPEEVRKHIFDPFFTTKDPGKGTGLGLTTVQGIIRSLGGHLELHSAPGEGSCFDVYLPIAEHQAAASAESLAAPALGHQELILIVDDEDAIISTLRRTLIEAGYRVLSARDGLSALDLFDRHSEDIRLLITDHLMPGMDGLCLCSKIRTHSTEVPIIIASGAISTDLPSSLLDFSNRLGRCSILPKPHSSSDLLALIEKALNPSFPTNDTPQTTPTNT